LTGWKENTVIVSVLDPLDHFALLGLGHIETEGKTVRNKNQNIAVLGAG